jgi:hypothetical protein
MITHPLAALALLSAPDSSRRRADTDLASYDKRRTGRARRRRSPRDN